MGVGAVCFDLDGTLVDSERLHWQAYSAVLRDYGAEIGLDEYGRRFIASGRGAEWACEHFRLPMDAAQLRSRKAAIYRKLIASGVPEMPGALACLKRLYGLWPLAVVTNSTRDEADVLLGPLGVTSLFDALVTREKYAEPKPAPDAYIAAAAILRAAPASCVAVEDTPRGVQAAHAAGLRAIAVPGEIMADQEFPGASRRVETLDGLTPELLRALGEEKSPV